MRHCRALTLLCLLTSCATPNSPAQTAFALEAGYDAAISVAIAYAMLPRCAARGAVAVAQPCSEPAIVRDANTAAHQAWQAVRAAQSAVMATRADPAASAQAIQAARDGLNALRAITDKLPISGNLKVS